MFVCTVTYFGNMGSLKWSLLAEVHRLVDLYVYLSCGQHLVHGVPGHLVVMASTPRPSIDTTLLGCPTKLVNG